MKLLNLLPLFLTLTISISCFVPETANAYNEETRKSAQDIYDIANYGEVKDRDNRGIFEFWGDMLSSGFGIVVGIIGFFIFLFIVIYIYYAVVNFFHGFTEEGRAERKEDKEREERNKHLAAFYLSQEKENLKREFREHKNKIKMNEEGKRTYHLCEQYMKLANYYIEGKAVDKDKGEAAKYFDTAIEYANQLFSEKTKDRKIKEFIARKNECLRRYDSDSYRDINMYDNLFKK